MFDITLNTQFFTAVLSIILIDLVLAGDNAVIIAMAVRNLPKEQRRKGIILGAGAAVALRVILTVFISQILMVSFIKLVGGIVILWIAVKLFTDAQPHDEEGKEAASLWQAVRLIIVADITMSTDNVLAVAGASHGSVFLLVFGLIVSIPFVVFTSNLLSMLMDKYPIIILLGAAVLGRVGGEMIMTDPYVEGLIAPTKLLKYSVEAFCTVGVIVFGKLLLRWRHAKSEKH